MGMNRLKFLIKIYVYFLALIIHIFPFAFFFIKLTNYKPLVSNASLIRKKSISTIQKTSNNILKYRNHRLKQKLRDIKWEFKPDELISINNKNDLEKKRKLLIDNLFGKNFDFKSLKPVIYRNFKDERYSNIKNLSRIDKLVHNMDFGINSIAYHFLPKNRIGKILIYHQGHRGDFILSKKEIQYFLSQGYDVLGVSMPLEGMNSKPVAYVKNHGYIKFDHHDKLTLLSNQLEHHWLNFFVEPIFSFNNYLTEELDYSKIIMAGISGGGWTTNIASAADSRIDYSFPISDSMPLSLVVGRIGHYERFDETFYDKFNYLDLYILGSTGVKNKRMQVKIHNRFDPGLTTGDNWKHYLNSVKEKVNTIGGGNFDIYVDESHAEHKLSEQALNFISKKINSVDKIIK